VELESLLQRFAHVIERGAVEEIEALAVHHHLRAERLEHVIARLHLVGVVVQSPSSLLS
jgi:hypothetical protein